MNYYNILGVSEDCTLKEIKTAYKSLAMKYHPDHHQGDKIIEEKFKIINKAYKILKNQDTRKKHNSEIRETELKKNVKPVYNPFRDNRAEDNFNIDDFIKNYEKNNLDNKFVVEKNVQVSIEEAFLGKNIEIKHNNKSFYLTIPQKTLEKNTFYIEHENIIYKIHILVENNNNIQLVGNDIFIKYNLDLKSMLIGGNINIEIFGTKRTFLLDECTQNGTILTIKKESFNNGNIFIELNAKLPNKLTPELREFLNKI